MNIKVHIERLVLDGLPADRGHAPNIQAAVEAELARLLATGGVHHSLAQGGAFPHVPGGSLQIAHGTKPSDLGGQIARTVYQGIGK